MSHWTRANEVTDRTIVWRLYDGRTHLATFTDEARARRAARFLLTTQGRVSVVGGAS